MVGPRRHPERSEAKSRDSAETLKGNPMGFLDFARNDSENLPRRYSRTCSAFFAWIHPRRSFGSAAYIQSPRVLRVLISLPAGNARTLFAVSAVARRAWTSLPVTTASAEPLLPRSSAYTA